MASCSYCDTFILFGGQTDPSGRYCGEPCQQAGNLLAISKEFPPETIAQMILEVHNGNCPRCGGAGPVDMHKAHQIWSALVLSSWTSTPELSCKSCAVKRQVGGIFFSGFLGWWGIPWGLIMTPVQIIKNFVSMAGGPKSGQPSELLQKAVRMQAAAAAIQASQAEGPPTLDH